MNAACHQLFFFQSSTALLASVDSKAERMNAA